MTYKIIFSGLLLILFLKPITIFSQVIDSTKIKYDAFVQEKKSKAKDKFTYSQFAIALRYKDSLTLSSVQIAQMYLEIDSLKIMKNAHFASNHESLDTRSYESERIIQFLTPAQHTLLLRLKNHSKAKSFAENDWKEIEIRNLQNGLSKASVVSELYEYYITRESLFDKFRHEPINQIQETRAHFTNNRPIMLKTLLKARKSNLNNTLGNNLNGQN